MSKEEKKKVQLEAMVQKRFIQGEKRMPHGEMIAVPVNADLKEKNLIKEIRAIKLPWERGPRKREIRGAL
jgi:hypothetical protein